jgi:hypothetical protein
MILLYHAWGRSRKNKRVLVGSQKEGDNWQQNKLGGRIILKGILVKCVWIIFTSLDETSGGLL